MNVESLREFCLSLPHTTEDIKWGADLCFCIGEKMYCVTGLNDTPFGITLKTTPEKFTELCEMDGITPAKYVGRYKWVCISPADGFSDAMLQELIRESYELIKSKLPKNTFK